MNAEKQNDYVKIEISEHVFDVKPEKILMGEQPLLTFFPQHDAQGSALGALYVRDGHIHFEGKLDESAEVFFQFVKNLWEQLNRDR